MLADRLKIAALGVPRRESVLHWAWSYSAGKGLFGHFAGTAMNEYAGEELYLPANYERVRVSDHINRPYAIDGVKVLC